jgi:quinol monooxygenase YgiN
MPWRRALWALALLAAILLAAPAALWAQGQYLDVYIAKVKPEKATDFEAIARKIADAERRNNGDPAVALVPMYGDNTTYVFISQRQDYADMDKGGETFMNALHKALGKPGTDKLMQDLNNCLVSSRSEVRMRRPDLSSKVPGDPQAFAKLIGESRVLRTIAVHTRPGHGGEFEALLKEVNAKAEHTANTQTLLVSQVVEGGEDAYYLTFLRSSLSGFDKNPTLMDILGEEGLTKFEKKIAESVARVDSAIYRFSAELSNPPKDIAEVAPDFWNPKPIMASAKAKPQTTTAEAKTMPAAVKSKEKPQQ